jgi:large subunit ribosomal protein L15
MKYNELQVSANKNKKRVGRGIAAGQGKTAGRGTKGQGARTGKKLNAMFQGGQRALVQAVPKARGFKSLRTPAQVVYLDRLNEFDGKTADNFTMFEAGLIATPFHTVKVIARGEITGKVTLKVQAASKSVQEALTKAGGSFEKVATPIQKSAKEAEANEK